VRHFGPLLVAAACVTGLLVPAQPVFAAPPQTGLTPRAQDQIRALAEAKARRSPGEAKIESALLTASQVSRGHSLPAGVRSTQVETDGAGRTRVVVYGTVTPALLARIGALGGVVRSSRPEDGVVSADLPVRTVAALGDLKEVRRVSSFAARSVTAHLTQPGDQLTKQDRVQQLKARMVESVGQAPAAGAQAAAASVVSEGDKVHGVDRARSALKVSGVGITVGVLSDGVDSLAKSVASANLPPDVKVLAPGNGDEGTAMLEIVHDLAPKAKLAFATANDTQEDFAANIRALRAAGADIIVDDVVYFVESPFQDGPVSKAVSAVTKDGALYFSSAGNEGNVDDRTSGNYEGMFRSSGRTIGKFGGTAHDFDPGPGVQVVNPTTARSADQPALLQWADPLGAADDDYDLYILDKAGNVVDFSNNTQDGDDDPFEGIINLPDVAGPLHIAVVKFRGVDRYFQLTAFGGRFAADGNLKPYVSPGVTRGHSTVSAAFSVAAAPAHSPSTFQRERGDAANPSGPFPGRYTTGQKSERFTSDGPRRVFFKGSGAAITPGNLTPTGGRLRVDPDFTAADGVRTSVPGFDRFFGSSASAPHAAAIAALALSGKRGLTAKQFRSAVQKTAVDIEGPGPDRSTGRGIIMAEPLLKAVGAKGQPFAVAGTPVVTSTADGDLFLEPGERAVVSVPVTNAGDVTARKVAVSLRSSTPGVTISPTTSSAYGTLKVGARRARSFTVSVGPKTPTGSPVRVTARVTFSGAFSPRTSVSAVPVGQPSTKTTKAAYSGPPVKIPDNSPAGVTVSIPVKGVGPVSKATFSLDGATCNAKEESTTVGLDHPFTNDLVGTLTSPDGTQVQVLNRVGGDGNNFCKAVFADSAKQSLDFVDPAKAPFTGTWLPARPLSAFRGKAGDGTWKFTVADTASPDSGTLRKLSIHLNGYVGTAK
jgi:subtilisin-like proprotein convertase family protein